MKLTCFIKRNKVIGFGTGNADYDTGGAKSVVKELNETDEIKINKGTHFPSFENGEIVLTEYTPVESSKKKKKNELKEKAKKRELTGEEIQEALSELL